MSSVARNRNTLDPMGEFSRLQNEINRLFDFGYPSSMSGLFDRHTSPSIDVVEKTDEILVYCDLPGVDKGDVDLSIAGNVLTIKGEKKKDEDSEGSKWYRDETWGGKFQRTISLPEVIDSNKVHATMKNGVLTINLAKMEEKKPKQIEVKVS